MNGISNTSCSSTQTCMQNNSNNICFNGYVGKRLEKYITKCAKGEVAEYAQDHPDLEYEALVEVARNIGKKWGVLLDGLVEKMSKAHKKSVLDYKYFHDGDFDGCWKGELLYRNSRIKGETIKRELFADSPGCFLSELSDDPHFLGYKEVIFDKTGELIPYGELSIGGVSRKEPYPYNTIYENIKDFAQKTTDTSFVNADKLVQKKDTSTSFFKKLFSGKQCRLGKTQQ